MIFKYSVEWEFEAETMEAAQAMLNEGKVGDELRTVCFLEAKCSDDRIIPRKWAPSKPLAETDNLISELQEQQKNIAKKEIARIQSLHATESGIQPVDDIDKYRRDDKSGASEKPSYRRVDAESGEEDVPF